MFDTLKYTKRLERSGFSKEQAEEAVTLGVEIMLENLATKSDLKKLETSLKHEFKSEFSERVHALEDKLTIRMGAMFAVSIAILGAMKFF